MKRLVPLFLFTSLFGALEIQVPAEAGVLIDADSGRVLWEKEAHVPRYPASITKVLTGLMVLEAKGDALEEEVVVARDAVLAISTEEKRKKNYKTPSHWLETNATHVGLKADERLSVETLFYGLMISSGNDAANALACHIAGDVPTFVEWMNLRAKQIGCRKTHFTNPHGLHHPAHQTTPYDMALMARLAMQHPIFRKVVGSASYTAEASNLSEPRTLYQKNRLLKKGPYHYPFATGVKIGFTSHSKGTLVAAAENGERSLIVVVMGCDPFVKIYESARILFQKAFEEKKEKYSLLAAGPQRFEIDVEGRALKTSTLTPIVGEFYPSQLPRIHYLVEYLPLQLPIAQGQEVGKVFVVDGEQDKELAWAPLYAAEAIVPKRSYRLFLFGGGALLLGLFLVGAVRRSR
ncbi:MAG: D-alanyl-D-alanine carboxypeptidase [Verrucomicrobia bacterium]|nr:D-alanyl-D-alanine carboxypeptidase [Verrucomicrobiota bacterium]